MLGSAAARARECACAPSEGARAALEGSPHSGVQAVSDGAGCPVRGGRREKCVGAGGDAMPDLRRSTAQVVVAGTDRLPTEGPPKGP